MHKRSFIFGALAALIVVGVSLSLIPKESESIASTQPVIQTIAPIKEIVVKKEIDEEVEYEVLASYIHKYNRKVSKADIKEIYENIKNSKFKYVLIGLMRRESDFEKRAFSKKKNGAPLAVGLTGINLCNVEELKEQGIITNSKDLWKIKENIKASEYLFQECLDLAKGDVIQALKIYWIGSVNYKLPKYKDATYPEDVLSAVGHIRIKMEIAMAQKKTDNIVVAGIE